MIIIRTKKANDGFHSFANGSISMSEVLSASGDVNVNYHSENGITVFRDFSYTTSGFRQTRSYDESFHIPENPGQTYHTETYGNASSRNQSLTADGGINYDFGKNSVGVRYSFYRTPSSRYSDQAMTSIDAIEGANEISSISGVFSQSSMHHVNAFGDFSLPAGIGLRIDADYVNSTRNSKSTVMESATSNDINNGNDTRGSLWAAKMTISKKFMKTDLEIGSDISETSSNQDFSSVSTANPDFFIPATDKALQNLYAVFASFDWIPDPEWNVYGGVRWETTKTDYRHDDIKSPELSRSQDEIDRL